MRYVQIASLLASLIFASALHEVAAQTRADPAAVTEARKVLEVTKIRELMVQILPQAAKEMTDAVARANPGTESEARRAVDELIMPELTSNLPSLVDEIAALYALHFTAEELRSLNAFYGTPLGQKAIVTLPQLMQQSMAIGSAWGARVVETAVRKAAPEFRKRGLKL